MSGDPRPLIVTLALDPPTQRRFDAERSVHFPAGRTVVGAHVTLFHALPGRLEPRVRQHLASVADRDVFAVTVSEVVSLGRGVAYRLGASELEEIHESLRTQWRDHLTAQDQQGFRPHVTVQNKVDADTARSTLAALRGTFRPHDVEAVGLDLWRYDDGPWTALARFPFRTRTAPGTGRGRG